MFSQFLNDTSTVVGFGTKYQSVNFITVVTTNVLFGLLVEKFVTVCDCVSVAFVFIEVEVMHLLFTGLTQYVPALQEMTITRLVKQVAQLYQSITFKRLLELSVFVTGFHLERILVDLVRHNDLQVTIYMT